MEKKKNHSEEFLVGSVRKACDSWSWHHEFKPILGKRLHKNKQTTATITNIFMKNIKYFQVRILNKRKL